MHRFTTECIVLKNINYKDADKIFTLYSKERGKITAVAKGIRKISSKRKGLVDTFNHIKVSITESSNSFDYLTEVVPVTTFNNLKASLDYSVLGYYVLELCDRLTESNDPNENIFDLLLKTLKLMESQFLDPKVVVCYFELSLVRNLGYAIRFDSCINCGKKFSLDWGSYRLNLALGGLVCNDCKNGLQIALQDAQFLHFLQKGKLVKDLKVSSETLSLIKVFIRSILEDNFKTSRAFGNF